MPKPEIEEFARILVSQVRDAAIRSSDISLHPDCADAIAKRWRESARAGHLEPIAKEIIPDVVDSTIRDAAIRSNDVSLDLRFTDAIATRWKESARTGQLEPIAKAMIPDTVDSTIFYLLHAIDEGSLQLSFTASNGKTVNLTKEGLDELGGWYMGEWRETLTKERFGGI